MKSTTSSRFAFQNTVIILPVSEKKDARYAELAMAFRKCPKLREEYHKSTPVLGKVQVYTIKGQTYVLACIHEHYNDKPLSSYITLALNDLQAMLDRSTKSAKVTFAMYPLGCRVPERISFLESVAAINASEFAKNCERSRKYDLNVVVSKEIEMAYNAWLMRQPVAGQAQAQQPKGNAFAKAMAHVATQASEERGLILLTDTTAEFQVEEILEAAVPQDCTDTGAINEAEEHNRRLYARLEQAKLKTQRLNPTGQVALNFTEEDKAELAAIIKESTSELQHDILFHEFCNRKLEAQQTQKSGVIYL